MQEEMQPARSGRRKKKRLRFRGILLLLLIALLAAGVYVFMQYQSGYKIAEENTESEPVSFDGDPENPDYTNILVMGVDSRGEEKSRTDTMMLLSHNK